MEYIKEIVLNIQIRDMIDIAIVAYVFYKVYNLIKETRAEQLIKGIVILLIAAKTSEVLKLYTINWILKNTMTVGVIALLIVFQPELRRGLEYLGRSNFLTKSLVEIENEEIETVVEEIVEATASLSRQKIGALIVFERETGLNEVAGTGSIINGLISSGLLINIFIPNTPLHDGAVIIKGHNIKAAGCFLPLTENNTISKELGTRHRAALGITEKSDSITLIVSEETGAISVAENGELKRYLDIDTLRDVLKEIYVPTMESKNIFNNKSFFSKWRLKNEKVDNKSKK